MDRREPNLRDSRDGATILDSTDMAIVTSPSFGPNYHIVVFEHISPAPILCDSIVVRSYRNTLRDLVSSYQHLIPFHESTPLMSCIIPSNGPTTTYILKRSIWKLASTDTDKDGIMNCKP